MDRRSTETVLPVGREERKLGVHRATEIVLGLCTVVVLEYDDGIIAAGRYVRHLGTSQTEASQRATLDGLACADRLRLKAQAKLTGA